MINNKSFLTTLVSDGYSGLGWGAFLCSIFSTTVLQHRSYTIGLHFSGFLSLNFFDVIFSPEFILFSMNFFLTKCLFPTNFFWAIFLFLKSGIGSLFVNRT